MFNVAQTERFAFESRVPADMSWMLMAGSLVAIGAMALVADLNRPRIGAIRVDPARLVWTIRRFAR